MAKIDFSHLERFSSFLEKNGHKADGDRPNRLYECVHLDFKAERAYMMTPRWLASVSIPLAPGIKGTKIPENFSVKAEDLGRVIRSFKTLEVEDFGFSCGEDRFNLQHWPDEDYVFPSLISDSGMMVLTIDDDIRQSLTAAATFMNPNPAARDHGLFLRGDRLIASNDLQLYEEVFSGNFDVDLPWIMAQFLISQKTGNVKISWDEDNRYIVNVDDVFLLQTASNNRLTPYETKDPEFIEIYDHPNYFVVNRLALAEVLKFIDPFVAQVVNQRVLLEFSPAGLRVRVLDGARIDRLVPVEYSDFSVFEGASSWVSARTVAKLLTFFETETVKFQYKPKAPVINLTETGDGPWRKHVFFVQYAKDGVA